MLLEDFGKTLICANFFALTDLYPGSCRGRGTRGNRPRRRWLWLDRWLRWHWDLKCLALLKRKRYLHAHTLHTPQAFLGWQPLRAKKATARRNGERKRNALERTENALLPKRLKRTNTNPTTLSKHPNQPTNPTPKLFKQ